MNYHELIQAYFERSVALQWYWTVYVVVIGGVLGFSTFRQRPEAVTVLLVTVLYALFAYKNLAAIEHTLLERQVIFSAIRDYPASGPNADDIKRVRAEVRLLPNQETHAQAMTQSEQGETLVGRVILNDLSPHGIGIYSQKRMSPGTSIDAVWKKE